MLCYAIDEEKETNADILYNKAFPSKNIGNVEAGLIDHYINNIEVLKNIMFLVDPINASVLYRVSQTKNYDKHNTKIELYVCILRVSIPIKSRFLPMLRNRDIADPTFFIFLSVKQSFLIS